METGLEEMWQNLKLAVEEEKIIIADEEEDSIKINILLSTD